MITEKKSYTSIVDAQSSCVHYLFELIQKNQNAPIVFFYSGGSCLPVLSEFIQQSSNQTVSNIVFTPIDERFDVNENNFTLFQTQYEKSYKKALTMGFRFIDTSNHKENQYEMADWYEQTILSEIASCKQKNGKIIGLMGMGEDGHTAGLFPHPLEEKEFYVKYTDTKQYVTGLDATGKNKHTKRFTLTIKGLELIDTFVLYIAGDKKKEVIQTIEHTHPSLHKNPVTYLYYTQKPCVLFMS